jgi:putative transcriptional regulator
LFRIKAGKAMPHHGHAAAEFTLVLQGGFSDEQGQYEVGDFTVADRDRAHQPVAAAHGCVCLILSSAPMQLTSRFGWLINPFMPF